MSLVRKWMGLFCLSGTGLQLNSLQKYRNYFLWFPYVSAWFCAEELKQSDQIDLTESLIEKFDDEFKHHLDRYKYATRYENTDSDFHRAECLKILVGLEAIASNDKWIFGKNLNKLDISILPFIRQFRIANPEWFDSLEEISRIKKILNNYLDSEEFKKIMFNYDEWELGAKPVYFPST